MYFQGQVGMVFGSTPELNVSSGSASTVVSSATANAVAFCLGAGAITASKVTIGFRYVYGSIDYDWTIGTDKIKFTQPTGVVGMSLGFTF